MSKYLLCLIVLAGVLAALSVQADIRKMDQSSLVSIFTNANLQDMADNRLVADKLSTWSKPLSQADVAAIKDFAAKCEHDDWQLYTLSQRLLRKNGLVPPISDTLEKAEGILMPLVVTKGYNTNCADQVNQMVALGESVIPVLKDVLSYPREENRKIVAIRTLVKFGDAKSIEILKSSLAIKNVSIMNEVISGLLSINHDDAAMDEMAAMIAKLDQFQQERAVRIVSETEIPVSSKMRFYSHYDAFTPYGKGAVLRSLGKIESKDSFEQLSAIFLKETNNGFAADQLTHMTGFDPCPVFLSAFKAGQMEPELIMGAAIRGCKDAVPYLEDLKTGKKESYVKSLPTLAAAALARLGKDTGKNTDLVIAALKDPKPDYYVYKAAGLLNDDAIAHLLMEQLNAATASKETYDLAGNILQALGSSSNTTAAKLLRDNINSLPTAIWDKVGDALVNLGTSIGDNAVKADGEGLKGTMYYTSIEYWAAAFPGQTPAIVKAKADAIEFLKKTPSLFPKLFSQNRYGQTVQGYNRYAVELAVEAWTPKATPIFEQLIRTDQSKIQVYDPETKTRTEHYRLREELAKLLTEKTGKVYTYVDCDGKTKKPGDPL